jgi:hypothetical protein
MKTLVAAVVYMCMSGHCIQYEVEIEKKACAYGPFMGRYMGMEAKLGVKCK